MTITTVAPAMQVPSFAALAGQLATDYRDGFKGPAWRYNDKIAGRALARQLGAPAPQILAGPARLTTIPAPSRPGVLKPLDGSTGWGVVPFTLSEDGRYRRLFTGETKSWQTITARAAKQWRTYREHLGRKGLAMWIVEELVTENDGTRLADDIKCYVIGGRVELIRQRHPGRGRGGRTDAVHCFWSRSWERLGRVDVRRRTANLPMPSRPAAIVHNAERIGAYLRDRCGTAFVRIDMYSGGLFGEITPGPAGDRFSPLWDRKLGETWLAARDALPPRLTVGLLRVGG